MLGIIGAMEEEVKQLKEKMTDVKIKIKAGMEFNSGLFYDKQVVVVRSGIGKVNAAVCTQILIDDYSVDAIINTGIAGSLNNEINIGDMVISTDALQHDVDATVFGYKKGVIPRMESSVFTADTKLGNLAVSICQRVNPEIKAFHGRIASGDQFISTDEKKQELVTLFHAFCAEMEGGAIAQTCYLNQVPFLIVRAISDKADHSAAMDYPTFEKQAIKHTVKLMSSLIMEYC